MNYISAWIMALLLSQDIVSGSPLGGMVVLHQHRHLTGRKFLVLTWRLIRLTGDSKLPIGVNVSMNVFSVDWRPARGVTLLWPKVSWDWLQLLHDS